jgi:hypothetical protein
MGNKPLGYGISVIGLVVLALSFLRNSLLSFLPSTIDKSDVVITGIVIVIVGVVIAYSKGHSHSSSVKQVNEEVPIYEGEGKHRKIVGYKKESK